MGVRADLHNHFSTYENYGNVFDKAMNVAQRNLGKDGIFGVINAQDNGVGRYENLLGQGGKKVEDLGNAFFVPSRDIYVVKGQEVFTNGGHILVLGLNKGVRLKDFRSLEDSLKEVKDNNGIIIADHPFFLDGIFKMERKLKQRFPYKNFDGIEVNNGEAWIPLPGYGGANRKAQEYFNNVIKKYGEFNHLGAISCSDGHSVREIGMSYTILEKPDFSSPEKLVDSLRKSVRGHRDWKDDKQSNSYRGALRHGFGVFKLRLKSKVGLIGRVN